MTKLYVVWQKVGSTINVDYYINTSKNKKHKIISIGEG